MTYPAYVKFLEDMRVNRAKLPDVQHYQLLREFSQLDALIEKAAAVLVHCYPSLQYGGYSAEQIIELCAEKYARRLKQKSAQKCDSRR